MEISEKAEGEEEEEEGATEEVSAASMFHETVKEKADLGQVGLDPPLRQGQTRYPFLVLQLVKDMKVDMELNMDKETIKKNYNKKLEEKYEDKPLFEVVSYCTWLMSKVHYDIDFPFVLCV
ncbi:3383_t:CDS:2 [Ambispora gerdemannii]|uniref:3383_t:CDS:1 n=1 Tax=Ambispora gerdemannii TaxID=144530 RepID=A0A9N8ZJF8_9GLOM|nr:3383_t:CDS:2 [Ambispora gerdemannii]